MTILKTSPRPRVCWPVCAALSLLLSGCSSDGGDWLALFRAARLAVQEGDAPVSLESAAAIPYATMGVRLDGGHEQILILATDNDGQRLWTASRHVAFTTNRGRIVRTAGLGTDLTGYTFAKVGDEDWGRKHDYVWSADYKDLSIYSVKVSCVDEPQGPDPVTILGKQIDTIKVLESCESTLLGWTFTNTYWVSLDTGRVWRSIQHVHPRGPTIEIELLRPPLSDR